MSLAIKELSRQHRECDDHLSKAEQALVNSEFNAASRQFTLFSLALDQHLQLEEDKLFPAFEKAVGSTTGPTSVMRHEHAEIRQLRDDAALAIRELKAGEALGFIETLNVMLQQHNVKEENILYPMCEQNLPGLNAMLGIGSPCCGACSCG